MIFITLTWAFCVNVVPARPHPCLCSTHWVRNAALHWLSQAAYIHRQRQRVCSYLCLLAHSPKCQSPIDCARTQRPTPPADWPPLGNEIPAISRHPVATDQSTARNHSRSWQCSSCCWLGTRDTWQSGCSCPGCSWAEGAQSVATHAIMTEIMHVNDWNYGRMHVHSRVVCIIDEWAWMCCKTIIRPICNTNANERYNRAVKDKNQG
jgi:hypothetical protein